MSGRNLLLRYNNLVAHRAKLTLGITGLGTGGSSAGNGLTCMTKCLTLCSIALGTSLGRGTGSFFPGMLVTVRSRKILIDYVTGRKCENKYNQYSK